MLSIINESQKGFAKLNTVSGISLHSFYADVENKLQVGEIKDEQS